MPLRVLAVNLSRFGWSVTVTLPPAATVMIPACTAATQTAESAR
jgi:hypothetical protein